MNKCMICLTEMPSNNMCDGCKNLLKSLVEARHRFGNKNTTNVGAVVELQGLMTKPKLSDMIYDAPLDEMEREILNRERT